MLRFEKAIQGWKLRGEGARFGGLREGCCEEGPLRGEIGGGGSKTEGSRLWGSSWTQDGCVCVSDRETPRLGE